MGEAIDILKGHEGAEKKLVDSEASSKVQGKQIKQLEEEAEGQYVVCYSWACLDLLRAFCDGQLTLADVEAKITKLAKYVPDPEEDVEPKDAAGETTGASGRLEEDTVKSIPVVESKEYQAEELSKSAE